MPKQIQFFQSASEAEPETSTKADLSSPKSMLTSEKSPFVLTELPTKNAAFTDRYIFS